MAEEAGEGQRELQTGRDSHFSRPSNGEEKLAVQGVRRVLQGEEKGAQRSAETGAETKRGCIPLTRPERWILLP